MKKNYKLFRRRPPLLRIIYAAILAFLLLQVIPAGAKSQLPTQSQITGTVVDANTKESLPGVSIVIKGTSYGVITDLDGNFTIEASTDDILIFSFVGYIDEEIQVGSSTRLSVELDVEFIDLKEIVVIGYGSQKKSDLTGAITSVSEEQLRAQPVASIDQALQGKAAGVTVLQTSGSPAGNVSVLVRGASSINASSQPLYVIDGIPISNTNTGGVASIDGGQGGQNSNPMATINPDDIESIEILKDASATAIYGSRGANGVILITTKRGHEGKNVLSFNAYYGLQKLPKQLDVLDSYNYARYRLMQTANNINSDTYPVFDNPLDPTDDQMPFTTLHPDSFPINTNWQDEMYQTAPMQNYHLAASGGTQKIRYSLSGGYYNVDGILIGSSYERLSLKANVDADLSKWFQMGNTLMFTYSKEDMTFNDAYYGGGLVERALQQRPDMAVRDSSGNYAGPPDSQENIPDNPIASELEKQNDNKVNRMVGNIYGQITFFKGFTFKTIFGMVLSNSRTTLFEPSVDRGAIYIEDARMQEAIQQNLYWSWENFATFNRKFADVHDLTLMAGYNRSYSKWDQFSAFRNDFPDNDSRNLALGSENQMSNGAYAGQVASESFYGRFVYDYNDLVTFTHTSRFDGSSKFGSGQKTGYFPSFAVAWKFSNHGFMQSVSFINFGKLRLGYGETGNDNIDPTDFLARLRPVTVSMNNTIQVAYEPDGKDNPDLHWETIKSFNLGLDLNMLESRLQLITDIYKQRSEDMLIQLPLPITSSPFGNPWSNSANMENKGLEINLIAHAMSGKFNWSITATYSYNKNKVLSLSETVIPQRIRTQDPMITQTAEGYPIAQFYGHVTDGLFRTQEEIDMHAYQDSRTRVGDIRFKDLNGDGVINDNDKAYNGNPIPINVFGLTNDFEYMGFDLSIFLMGMTGNKAFNMVKRNMESMNSTNNQFTSVLNAYTPEDIYLDTDHGRFLVAAQNTTGDVPRMSLQDYNNNQRYSDRYVEDAAFLKIQTVTFGYTLPKKISQKISATRLRFYVTGKNLYTFTKYSGYEPEHGSLNNNQINNALLSGVDLGNYPIPRSVVFGINLDF